MRVFYFIKIVLGMKVGIFQIMLKKLKNLTLVVNLKNHNLYYINNL